MRYRPRVSRSGGIGSRESEFWSEKVEEGRDVGTGAIFAPDILVGERRESMKKFEEDRSFERGDAGWTRLGRDSLSGA